MKKCHRLWALTVVLGLVGCAGEDSKAPARVDAPPPKAGAAPAAPPEKARAARGPDAGTAEPNEPGAGSKDGTKGEAPSLEGPKTDASGDQAPAVALTDEEVANIKKLPEAEQAEALKQAVCPVSDEHLGAMDKPVKATAEGKTVYLCCDTCEPKLKADPQKYLAKLGKK